MSENSVFGGVASLPFDRQHFLDVPLDARKGELQNIHKFNISANLQFEELVKLTKRIFPSIYHSYVCISYASVHVHGSSHRHTYVEAKGGCQCLLFS